MDFLSSATRIASEVAHGQLASVDVVAASLERFRNSQQRLNTATFIDAERALARAEEIDRAVASGEQVGPLAGVPVGVKDLIDHAGRVTTCGSQWYRSEATFTAPVIQRLEAAGAVVVARLNLHEFAFGYSSENDWFGPVRNPWDPATSCGGSSGGSAAAVAAGLVPIAVGTDTGGSVRVPAALCGVAGLKVTHGRVPLSGVFPLAPSLDTVGPLAASVADLALAYQVMAGFDPTDPWSQLQPVITPGAAPPDLKGLRIGVPTQWVDSTPVSEEVGAAFSRVVPELQRLGADVEEIDDPELAPPGLLLDSVYGEVARIHRQWWEEGRRYGREVAPRLEEAMQVTLDRYVEARTWRARLRQRAEVAFGRVQLLLTPSVGTTRKVVGEDEVEVVDGRHFYRGVLAGFAALVNHAGLPAVALPLQDAGAPPPSIQLVAPAWQEHRLLEVSAALEKAGLVSVRLPADGR